MKCTCGPHPHINLTSAYFNYHHHRDININCDDDASSLLSIRRQVQNACQSHGCFHVTISLSSPTTNTSLPIKCLAKPTTQIENDIESLFTLEYLQRHVVIAKQQPDSAATNNCSDDDDDDDDGLYETICNSGLVDVVQSNGQHLATFRGRLAESGSNDQCNVEPEPKLSWEYRRCRCCCHATTNNDTSNCANTTSTNGNDTSSKQYNDNDDNTSSTINNLLPTYTNALHSVACTIIHLLGIPSQLALQEDNTCHKKCSPAIELEEGGNNHCQQSSSNGNTCCNIDLLRVFRYDAISPLNNDNSTTATTTMGSSPHSDWGTITVVWQDNKGGLQTYCSACDKWSNVDTTASADNISATSDNDEEDEEEDDEEEGLRSARQSNSNNEKTCSLFVHVGDFLSLASIRGEGGYPMFPSPRHRVLSPMRRFDEDVNTSKSRGSSSSYVKDYCRRSLVYFAYPPPNVTLNAVQQVVSSILDPPTSSPITTQTANVDAAKGKKDDTKQQHHEGEKLYSNYSLLHNQSQQQQQSASSNDMDNNRKEDSDEDNKAMATYQHIRSIPFHEVIYDKWNQVQRGKGGSNVHWVGRWKC